MLNIYIYCYCLSHSLALGLILVLSHNTHDITSHFISSRRFALLSIPFPSTTKQNKHIRTIHALHRYQFLPYRKFFYLKREKQRETHRERKRGIERRRQHSTPREHKSQLQYSNDNTVVLTHFKRFHFRSTVQPRSLGHHCREISFSKYSAASHFLRELYKYDVTYDDAR